MHHVNVMSAISFGQRPRQHLHVYRRSRVEPRVGVGAKGTQKAGEKDCALFARSFHQRLLAVVCHHALGTFLAESYGGANVFLSRALAKSSWLSSDKGLFPGLWVTGAISWLERSWRGGRAKCPFSKISTITTSFVRFEDGRFSHVKRRGDTPCEGDGEIAIRGRVEDAFYAVTLRSIHQR